MKAAFRTVLGTVLFAGMFVSVWLRVGMTAIVNTLKTRQRNP